MSKVFVGFRQLGPDTIVGAKYIKRNEGGGSFERKRAELQSYKKAKAIETANRFCTTCANLASQIAMYDCDGATRLERYCQTCIDANKHLKENDLMDNFDNLFIKAEPGSAIYEKSHAKNPE
jgi:hypothetical protein